MSLQSWKCLTLFLPRFLAAFENDEQAYFEHYADPELRALKLLSDLWDDCDEEHDGVLTEDQFVALFRRRERRAAGPPRSPGAPRSTPRPLAGEETRSSSRTPGR